MGALLVEEVAIKALVDPDPRDPGGRIWVARALGAAGMDRGYAARQAMQEINARASD